MIFVVTFVYGDTDPSTLLEKYSAQRAQPSLLLSTLNRHSLAKARVRTSSSLSYNSYA